MQYLALVVIAIRITPPYPLLFSVHIENKIKKTINIINHCFSVHEEKY